MGDEVIFTEKPAGRRVALNAGQLDSCFHRRGSASVFETVKGSANLTSSCFGSSNTIMFSGVFRMAALTILQPQDPGSHAGCWIAIMVQRSRPGLAAHCVDDRLPDYATPMMRHSG
jgi:hypothetical protein